MTVRPEILTEFDDQLSKRFIHLDPAGYFLIYADHETGLIIAKLFSNDINERGLAVDPETGEPFPVRGKVERTPIAVYTGRTAKEIGIKITEAAAPCPMTKLDHALYLGREFARAEQALVSGNAYVQD